MNNQNISYWILAVRPKTLSITVAPIMAATAMVYAQYGNFSGLTLLIILISALFIQIGTNLYNDAADYERGADNSERLGPDRVTAKGWLSADQVKTGAYISFLLSFIGGIYLAYLGGVPIIALGLLSILCGYAYTGGPFPIAYSPLGELFVILFFGLAAVTGSYYLLSGSFSALTLLFGLSLGCFAAAILLVNNYRDLDQDIKANKLTLCFYLGRGKARILYQILLIVPYLFIIPMILNGHLFAGLVFVSLPYAILLIKTFYQTPISKQLNLILVKTAKLQLLFSLLASIGLIFS